MAERYKNSIDISESGNWNVAGRYTDLKIMKWLYLIDVYEEMAKFGTSSMLDELIVAEDMKNKSKVIALSRLFHTTLKLIKNTKFAIRLHDDKERLENFLKDLLELKKLLPLISYDTFNQKTKKKITQIETKNFNFVLDKLIDINSEILEPLNRANLIFTSVDEFDPDKIKKQMEEDITFAG